MNLKHFLSFVALASLATVGCDTQSGLKTGIDPKNMDQTVKPGDNFYDYACGGWRKAHPLSPEYARFGTFEELIENNNKQLRGLI